MKKNKGSKKYTRQELASGLVFPVKLSLAEKKEAAAQLMAARKKSKEQVSASDKLALELFQFKFRLEDYIQNKEFNPDFTFGYFLKQYVDLLHLKRKDFAYEISIDETLLSQFINMHRLPPEYIVVRLEIHSNNSIPATHWFKLVEKQKEHELETDVELRRKEHKYVHRKLAV